MTYTATPSALNLGLHETEHLLLWTMRVWVAGRDNCPLLAEEFSYHGGSAGEELLEEFLALLKILGRAGRRRFRIAQPDCLSLTGDEKQLLALIAAAQAEKQYVMAAHLHWLVRSEQQSVAVEALMEFGALLKKQGLLLVPATETIPSQEYRSLRAVP